MDVGVLAVAKAYLVLGLAVACFALYAISLDPATFQQLQLQIIKDSGDQLEQGQTDCTVTAAEVVEMRAGAVVLLLLGAAEALMATTAVVAVAWAPVLTVCAQLLSLGMATRLAGVLAGVVDLSIGRCHDQGIYSQALVFGYFAVTVSFGLLFIVGLLIALFDSHGIYRQARRILGASD